MEKYKHLEGLNDRQRQAVEQLNGPLLILAGAGSGKTRVITHRIAQLIATGTAKPWQILAVTFTNKAAGEMKQRVIDLLGPDGGRVWVSTFHSFCARTLRDHGSALGYIKSFSIYDESESLALIKRIYKDKGLSDTQPTFGAAKSKISKAKDKLLTPADYANAASDFLEVNAATIYDEYQKRLAKNQAMDFDDLLMKTVELFEKRPDILKIFHDRYKYLMVDEYQDTNHCQYRLVKLLAAASHNLCVVGDDDQSIYAWRGADISNILDFEKDYPECKEIKLEQNYRSTQIILDAAGEVVSKNLGRKAKKLFTEKKGGDKITLLLCGDEVNEGEAIAEKIRLGITYDKSPSDYAVLYRTNAQSRVIEDSLRYKGLPYKIVGGIRFYERAEVKDILAYLRLLINPADDIALLRIINMPRRGVGKTSIERLESHAAKLGMPLMQVLLTSMNELEIGGKAKLEIQRFIGIMNNLSEKLETLEPHDIAARVIEDIKYLRMLEEEATPEADVRADNVRELVSGIEEYCERTEAPTLAGFLEEVALISDIDTLDSEAQAVTLMTLHSAKGLEFDSVFMAGMEDGLFPLRRNYGEPGDMEEERRLCYVGITRAKNKLYMSMAGFRRRWGDFTGGPSEFLQDIPEEMLEVERFNYWNDVYIPQPRGQYVKPQSKPSRKQTEVTFESVVNDMLAIGTAVMHDKFGHGIVMAREGSGDNLMVTVRFERAGTKKLMVKYASLEVLGR